MASSNPFNPQIVRSMRRTITLQVHPDGSVVVKAPIFVPTSKINEFIEKSSDWIRKRLKTIEAQPKSKAYQHGEKFLFLGQDVHIEYGAYASISVNKDKLLVPETVKFRIKKELNNWYIKQAREAITDRVLWYSKRMNATFADITFSDTRSQWGRCTHDNRLQFSWRLIMAPLLVINYVVVHELAHTKEKNHSQAFWRIVRYHNPTYRQQREWLKRNGNTLII